MLRAFALKAIFFGLLFFWASKRKVTRAAAADRNARCVSGQIAEAPHKSEQRIRGNQVQSHWMTSLRLLKSASCLRRNDELSHPSLLKIACAGMAIERTHSQTPAQKPSP